MGGLPLWTHFAIHFKQSIQTTNQTDSEQQKKNQINTHVNRFLQMKFEQRSLVV